MAKPLRFILDFLSYEGTLTNDPQDAVSVKRKVEEANVTEVSRQMLSVPASSTDLALALPDATCDYVVINIDRPISMKLNGSSTAINLKPKTNGTKTPVFYIRGGITSVSVTTTTDAVNIDIIAVKV